MTSIDLAPREKICCFTYFLTPKLNFSACSKKASRKAVFWTISPRLNRITMIASHWNFVRLKCPEHNSMIVYRFSYKLETLCAAVIM